MKQMWFISAFAAVLVYAADPVAGEKWTIETGEQKSLADPIAVPELQVDGELTLENGAALSVNGDAVNSLGTMTDKSGVMTIKSGATATFTGTLDAVSPGDSQGLALGEAGGHGTLTVEAGGSLTVANGRLFLGRNGGNDNRSLNSQGVLNIFGTVTSQLIACGAWYPSLAAADYGTYDVSAFTVAGEINLEEGGVLETGNIMRHDQSRTVINCKGGTLRALRENSDFISNSGALLLNIEEGKSLVFDTQNFNIRILPSTIQPDFFMITGEGGFVKKGTGYLQICNYAAENTFSGSITVEEGILAIGRPLAEGQTVYVKKGAQFYPAGGGDLDKITYEDPSEAPAGGLYCVQTRFYNGLDLRSMAPTYYADALGGPIWGWGGEIYGEITYADGISLEHPFRLVGQGNTLNLYDTGLDKLPFEISGTGTFRFSYNRTNSTDSAITFIDPATYEQNGSFNVVGQNGERPVMTVTGPGTFKTGNLRVGLEGGDGALVLKDGVNVSVNGALRIGSNASGDTRQTVRGRVELENATLTTSGDVNFAPNGLIDGSDLTSVLNELVLGPGSNLKVGSRITRNDDARSRITFAGGKISPQKNYSEFFYNGQNGTLEIEAAANHDASFNLGPYSIGMFDNHTHLFGDGGLEIIGSASNPIGSFTLGKPGLSDFEVSYRGETKITDATLKLGVPLPEGNVISGTHATIEIGGYAIDPPVGDVRVKGPGTVVVGRDNADTVFDCQIEGAQILKIGTGSLLLDTALNSGALTVREGTATVKGTASYSSYRFKVENIKGPLEVTNVNSMQLAELILLNGTMDVTRPYKSINFDTMADNDGTTCPANEGPGNLVDGNFSTKWLDFRAHPSRSAADRDRVWLQIDYDTPKTVTGYIWVTANDVPGRDPAAWRLQGSNDGGTTWTDLDVQTDYVASDVRFSPTGLFTMGGAFGSATVVTVAPGATLRVDGGSVPVSTLENSGTVELVNGATLTSDGGYLNGTVSGSGSVEVTGGTVTLIGTPDYTGITHVAGGVLNVGVGNHISASRGFDGKFFRLTIKSSNGGNGYENGTYNMQASEFQLYNETGEMQNMGLKMQGIGLAATALQTNSFTCAAEYSNATGDSADLVKNLFDGDLTTRWYCDDSVNGQVLNYHVITMRLADEADPVTSYNFFTAHNNVRRSPTSWTLEGSRDGVAWEVLDERYWAPHTTYDVKGNYSAESIQRKPFNNGVNYTFEPLERPVSFNGKFLRFTFKRTVGNTMLQFSELMVFNALGENEAYGLTMAADALPAASLQPGTFSRGGNYSVGKVTQNMDNLFDNEPNTKLCANNNDMNGDVSRYRIVTMRLRDEALPVNGYLLVTANDNLDRSPCDWQVEGSFDGETWITLDEKAGVAKPYCLYTAMNAGHPFTFDSYPVNASFPSGSPVQVDSGAVMNLNSADTTIGALRVDCTIGGGTIAPFRPKENGVLDLVNVQGDTTVAALDGFEIPLTVNGVEPAGNLTSWKVSVEGVVRDDIKIRLNEEGNMVLFYGGTLFLIR